MRHDLIAESWEDYLLEREEADAREDVVHWHVSILNPCCTDCGWLTYAKEELLAARKRAYAAGVYEEQPGEAEWMTAYRYECSISAVEAYLSVEIG